MLTTNKNSGIQSLYTGWKIIETIKNHGRPLKFTEIQKITNINKSNLYKYIHSLLELKLVYRNKADGTYSLGSKLVEYGMAAIGQEDVIARVEPYLLELNQESQCTALFVTWTQEGPIVARIAAESRGLNIGAQIGTSLPLRSSSGKIFYTFMPSNVIFDWLTKEYDHLKESERTALQNEREDIKKLQIAFAEEPLVPGVSSASVPIFNYKKDLLGALTLVGFTRDVPSQVDEAISQKLISTSEELSHGFGYENEVYQQ
ncbi:helix-turn-helix domain-containing protein [Aliibacillus thermotolerans]|nr:helix-turn-helix domain-containing protein [Aliibacillus thermotolerans]